MQGQRGENMSEIKVKARRDRRRDTVHGPIWNGFIEVWENGRRMWSQGCPINSTSKADALAEAEEMRNDLLYHNGMNKCQREALAQ